MVARQANIDSHRDLAVSVEPEQAEMVLEIGE
jgi:hypothetical protein